jgi:hypothetical protein
MAITKRTTALLDEFEERDDWLGYGYLGHRSDLGSHVTETREYPGKPAVRQRVDRAVLAAADELGWTDEMLFHWCNSKMGHHYAEDSGDFRRTSTAARDRAGAIDSMRYAVAVFEQEMPDTWKEAQR